MSNTQAQGSILLKILVVIATVILVAVILIPGQIWEEEEQIKEKKLYDIESVYEAQRYYYNLNQEYTSDVNELLTTIHNDSTLEEKKQIVDYTTSLKTAIDNFLDQPIIAALVKITLNINNIESDFESNKIYFAKFEEIKTRAEELNFKILVMKEGVDQVSYSTMSKELDSLLNLRRDLTDYQLQVAARHAYNYTSSIVSQLPEINFDSISEYWKPLEKELTDLMLKVNSTELKQRTAVADRVTDFQTSISSGLRSIGQGNLSAEISNAETASEKVNEVYKEFLNDYLTTGAYVQYALSDVDAKLLNLSESNFTTPKANIPYIYQFMDTLGLVVEDPTLVDELKEKATVSAGEIKAMPFYNEYLSYISLLDTINNFAAEVKVAYRRNAEVHFKTKDINAVIDNLKSTSTLTSFVGMQQFATVTPNSNSYSQIKELTEEALLGVGLFKQVAETQIYGKLDTVHLELVEEMNRFDELLSGIRRNKFSFDTLKTQINDALAQIKANSSGASLVQSLAKVEGDLQDLFLFVSEGKEESVYGVFTTKITNVGKMYGRTGEKSWEEE